MNRSTAAARETACAPRWRRAGWAGLLFVLLPSFAHAQGRHVVLLQSFDRGHLVVDQFTSIFRVQLDDRLTEPVTFSEFVVNPAGFDQAPEQAMLDFLRTAFADRPKPDLVLTTGGPAAAFARNHRAELFPDSRILYAAVDQRFLRGEALTDREAAVAVANDPAGIIGDILRLVPETENIFIVLGAGELGRFWRQEFEGESRAFRDRVKFTWSDGMRYAEMLEHVSHLPPRSAIFVNSFEVDAEGIAYPTERVLTDLRGRAAAPLFGGQSAELGFGVVGGNLISIDEAAGRTADVASRILAGAMPSQIATPIQQPGPYMFDWRELQRWGVSEDRLPPGSIVRFRQPGVWERYRWPIISGSSAFVAQTVLIAALLVSRTRRRRAEALLRESEGRFRVLANAAPVMIRMCGTDMFATDFNVSWLTFTGRSLDAERGTGWIAGVHPDDIGCIATYRRAFERREPFQIEYRLRRADGEYRWLLDTGKPLFTEAAFAGYIASAIDITDQKTARAALSTLNRRLIEAQEQERSRVARELHDDVCQQLSMLSMHLDRLSRVIPESAVDARKQARDLHKEAGDLGLHVSAISHRLYSPKLELFGLATTAGLFCKEIASRHGVQVEYVHENVPAKLPDGVAINMFRVLQEALANAVKHSGGSRYRVSLIGSDRGLQLDVSDDGRGFDMAAALATPGIGLLTMQERLNLIRGEITIESRPGSGTVVRAMVPIPQPVS
jgi:PAS domain S-box-containing protein